MQFVLLHSPLVGPSTWVGVASALRAAGHAADVPDLRDAATGGRPKAVERLGGHLDIVNEPEAIARSIIELAVASRR